MNIPSFEPPWTGPRTPSAARIYVLEIRDREVPGSNPIAWLFVERVEKVELYEGAVYTASIALHYKRIVPKGALENRGSGCFNGSYSRRHTGEERVSLTAPPPGRGAVELGLHGLEGQRIGTYLMNEIVRWAGQWPDAKVARIQLVEGQGIDERNRVRRNRFYEQFNIAFDFEDATQRAGWSRRMWVRELVECNEWTKNIKVLSVDEYLTEALHAGFVAMRDLAQKQDVVKGLRAQLDDAQSRPIRFALQRLWPRYLNALIGGAMAAVLALVLWLQYRTG